MEKDLKIWIKNELENMEKFKVKVSLKLTNDVSFVDRTSLNSSLEILIKNIDIFKVISLILLSRIGG